MERPLHGGSAADINTRHNANYYCSRLRGGFKQNRSGAGLHDENIMGGGGGSISGLTSIAFKNSTYEKQAKPVGQCEVSSINSLRLAREII